MRQYRVIRIVGRAVEEIEADMNDAAAVGYVWEGKEMICARQASRGHYQSGAASETLALVMERDLPVDKPVLES